jgi:alkanesulfonate monooxygenase SsuD/methylene tetrahydromethanopterin reductase-like flavin-dependent oxidoreductase (luciferase family)
MDIGAAMFFTDYSIAPSELGRALEARGFESVWAPEHSHIPSARATPFRKAVSSRRSITT